MLLCLLCIFVLYVILALWQPGILFQLLALLFVCFIRFLFVVRSRFYGELRQSQGRELVDRKLVKATLPSNFIAGHPKAALLFWYFGDFKCGMLLFMVILVIYKWAVLCENRA